MVRQHQTPHYGVFHEYVLFVFEYYIIQEMVYHL